MNSAGRSVLLIALMLSPIAAQTPELKSPVEPQVKDPAVSEEKPRSGNEREGLVLSASLVFASGSVLRGSLRFTVREMIIGGKDTHDGRSRKIAMEEISAVSIHRWKGRRDKGNMHVFYPAEASVALKNGDVYRTASITPFHKLLFTGAGRESTVFTYFYARLDRKGWEGYTGTDMSRPETHPHEKTVVEIRFLEKTLENDPTGELLKHFLK